MRKNCPSRLLQGVLSRVWRGTGVIDPPMTVVDETPDEPGSFPSFELAYRYDDADTPRKVTVFDADADDITTAWITTATDHAVSLDEVV